MKFCTECGSPLNGSTNFCPNCGCNLKNITTKTENNTMDIEYLGNQDESDSSINTKKSNQNTLTNSGTLVLDKNDIQNAINANNEETFDEIDEYIPDSSQLKENYTSDSPSTYSDEKYDDDYDDGYIDDDGYYDDDEYYDDEDGYVSEEEYPEDSKQKIADIKNSLTDKLGFLKNKKNRTIAIAVAAIIGVLAVSTFTYKQMNSPNRVATKFEKAIDNKDAKALSKIAASVNTDLEITEESVQPFIDYCSENSSYSSDIKNKIKEQVKNPASLSNGESQSDAVVLAKSGGLLNKAVISIKPLNLNIESTGKGATVTVSGKNLGTISEANKEQKIGPVVPGKHKLVGSFDSSFAGTVSEESDVNLIAQTTDVFPLFKNNKSVQIKGNDPEAIIYIDGKSSNIKVKDAENFFPVTEETELYAVGDKDGKKQESPKVKVKKQKYIQLNTNGKASVDSSVDLESGDGTPIMTNTNANAMLNVNYRALIDSTLTAVTAKDPSLLYDHILKDSNLIDDVKDFVEEYHEDGKTLYLKDYNYTNVKFNKDLTKGTFDSTEIYNIQGTDNKPTTKTFKYVYEFEYNKSLNKYQFTNRNER